MPTPAVELAITVFSSLGCVLNNALFISQTPMLRRLVKEGDSTRYPFLPSLTLMSVMLAWSIYTVYVTPLVSIMVANFPGVVINLTNLMVIAWYSKSRARGAGVFALAWLCLGAVFAIFVSIFERHERAYAASTAGAIMATLNACFFLSPLRALAVAVRKLDVSAVPTSLSYVQLLQSGVWIVVGVLYPDNFIIGVNSAGAVLALVQIALISYVRYRTRAAGEGTATAGGKKLEPAAAAADGESGAGAAAPPELAPVAAAAAAAVGGDAATAAGGNAEAQRGPGPAASV